MSDDDRDIDIESDIDGEDSDSRLRHPNNAQYCSQELYEQNDHLINDDDDDDDDDDDQQTEKRARHNALERKRRDNIKKIFSSLKNAVPTLQGEKAEKRAHHNALERKRRDHIKDSFSSLKNAVPTLQGEKAASRAQILKKAAEYIQTMRKKIMAQQQNLDDLKKQNDSLDIKIRALEKAVNSGNITREQYEIARSEISEILHLDPSYHTDSETSDSETDNTVVQPKKLKVAGLH